MVEVNKVGTTTTLTYLHSDLLGSPRAATSATKSFLWQEHYDPYGKRVNGTGSKLGYTGHAHDAETGYTYMQARFYDAQVGRLLSTDPVDFQDSNPFTFNRYSYANNNPYRFKDPTGQWADTAIDIGFIMADLADIQQNGWSFTSGLALAADVLGAVVPGATGLGLGVRAVGNGTDAARISGNAQVTRAGGNETSHASTSQRIANEQAQRPDAESVHLNQTIKTITNGDVDSPLRPDVATVRSDGKVDVNEVLSPRQDAASTTQKYQEALGPRAGQVNCMPADKC